MQDSAGRKGGPLVFWLNEMLSPDFIPNSIFPIGETVVMTKSDSPSTSTFPIGAAMRKLPEEA